MVYVNVQRGGPAIGTIQPAQQDYTQATKASGNGGFQMMVFSPATVQEAVDMTYAAFDYAQRDRNPVLILTDGVMGTIMEPVVLPEMRPEEEVRALKEALRATSAVGHDSTKEPARRGRRGPLVDEGSGAKLPRRRGALQELEEGRAGRDALA